MKKTLALPIGVFYIHENYLVAEINQGATVTIESNAFLEDIAQKYFASKKFVYITHRINSYAVDPITYTRTSQIENLAGFAVVSKNIVALSNAEIEKIFLKKPFGSFNNLNEAIDWAQFILKSKE